MMTGRRAFAGDDVPQTLAFVITKEPDWKALPTNTPSAIRRLLLRTLVKDPKERLHAIADARLDITVAGGRDPARQRRPLHRRFGG